MNDSSFKDLQKSINGFDWLQNEYDENLLNLISENYTVADNVAKILSKKKIPFGQIPDFLNPKIKNLLPDPSVLKDMESATELISKLIIKKRKIGIFGDFDVDGITSTSIICLFFEQIKNPFEFYIPDRIREGYGPNIEAFKELQEKKCELIITVDCGITSNDVIQKAKDLNITTIIIDHHAQFSTLPDAKYIINPNQSDDKSGLNNLAAVGVVFLFLISLKRKLKKKNFFNNVNEPNLIELLDLVALGTVCDQVKQDLINRSIIKSGLKLINSKTRMGIRLLVKKRNDNEKLDEYHLGFIIGPKINAAGRIGDSNIGVKLLMSNNLSSVNFYSEKLSKYNHERKRIERNLTSLAFEKVNSKSNIICLSGENWHQGIIGIVASRISQKFFRPVIIISENDKICKGSCRSISGFNIGKLIKEAKDKEIIISGGGHEMAAGLSIEKKKIPLFLKFLDNFPFENKNEIMLKYFDVELNIININKELYEQLKDIAPYGPGNPKPIFFIKNCYIKNVRHLANQHIVCQISNVTGNSVNAIIFKAFDTNIGGYISKYYGESVGVICYLRNNNWEGKDNIEIEIIDIVTQSTKRIWE